jgi:hypothetical protein
VKPPNLVAAACERNGKLLLARGRILGAYWELPIAPVPVGEDARGALAQLLSRDLRLQAQVGEELEDILLAPPSVPEPRHVCVCSVELDQAKVESTDTHLLSWFSPAEAHRARLGPVVRVFLMPPGG